MIGSLVLWSTPDVVYSDGCEAETNAERALVSVPADSR